MPRAGRRPPGRAATTRLALAAALICALGLAAFLLLRDEEFVPADTRGAVVRTITVESDAVGRDLETSVVIPAGGGEGRPLLVFLHGRGGDERSLLDYESLFEELRALGPRAPVIALPDGGESSYWHERDDGDWASYVLREVIPGAVAVSGADPRRVAVGGISMGGFGAFHLAATDPGRFCAVGGHSPAIWEEAGLTAPGAFDDAEDFARTDVIAAAADPSTYDGTPLWIDAGEEDPFIPGAGALAETLRESGSDIAYRVFPGAHEGAYWEEHFPQYLRFYAQECGRPLR